jgi:hypothetical protein
MALVMRRQYVQDRIEGREPSGYSVDDYAVVDGTRIGRIWREVQNGAAKWLWTLQVAPAQPTESGIVDTLEQARAAVSKRWREVKERA